METITTTAVLDQEVLSLSLMIVIIIIIIMAVVEVGVAF